MPAGTADQIDVSAPRFEMTDKQTEAPDQDAARDRASADGQPEHSGKASDEAAREQERQVSEGEENTS